MEIIRPLRDDRPYLLRSGFTAMHIAYLVGGLQLPWQLIVQELLSRFQVHASQMSPYFYCVLALCHMLWHDKEGKRMTTYDFRNLVAVSEVKK